jgi:hypothetical protein
MYKSSYYYRNLEACKRYYNKVVEKIRKLPKDEHVSLKSMEMHVGLCISLSLPSNSPPTLQLQ